MDKQKCGKTHVQFFVGNECIATVRTEYADVFEKAIEGMLVPTDNCAPIANRYATEEK